MKNNNQVNNVVSLNQTKNEGHAFSDVMQFSLTEKALFILKLLGEADPHKRQRIDAKIFVSKWCRHYSFKSLVMELSLMRGNTLVIQRVAPQFTLREGKHHVASIFNEKLIANLKQFVQEYHHG